MIPEVREYGYLLDILNDSVLEGVQRSEQRHWASPSPDLRRTSYQVYESWRRYNAAMVAFLRDVQEHCGEVVRAYNSTCSQNRLISGLEWSLSPGHIGSCVHPDDYHKITQLCLIDVARPGDTKPWVAGVTFRSHYHDLTNRPEVAGYDLRTGVESCDVDMVIDTGYDFFPSGERPDRIIERRGEHELTLDNDREQLIKMCETAITSRLCIYLRDQHSSMLALDYRLNGRG